MHTVTPTQTWQGYAVVCGVLFVLGLSLPSSTAYEYPNTPLPPPSLAPVCVGAHAVVAQENNAIRDLLRVGDCKQSLLLSSFSEEEVT